MFDLEQYRENNRIEAKLAHGGLPESLWETYSAFANTLGGYILLGVTESADKTLRAADLPDPERLIAEFWRLLPKRASVNLLTKEDVFLQELGSKRIVVIRVPRALPSDRPVYVGVREAYRRGGEGDHKCSPEEIEAMCRDSAPQDGDGVMSLAYTALCAESLAIYKEKLFEVRPEMKNLCERELLCRIGALDTTGEHPTVAGLLMFGKKNAVLSVFPDFSAVFADMFSEYNLCRFYFRAHQILSAYDGDMATALCEALLNAVINADYRASDPVRIEILPERATFSNAGGFRIHPENAKKGGISDARCPTLAAFFRFLRRGAGLGSGLPHIYRVWSERGLPAPVITELFIPDRILLTLYFVAHDRQEMSIAPLSLYRGVVISYLTEHPNARLSSLATHLGLHKDTVRILLSELVSEGLVEPTGTSSCRAYRLKV